MIRSVPELAETLTLIAGFGLLLAALYVITYWLSNKARRDYRARMRETERSLIGQRVLVIRTIKPPDAGEIVSLRTTDQESPHTAYARRVLWAGQRARVTSTRGDGYVVSPIDTPKKGD
ncbi:MAG TPA: hypothetical protein GXZ89_08290 [Fastidiosipila sp.]|jgi:membrane protein implicated in regulation of membrane protease activity|nr:hypothetical protein [Fastidiosipila sp.]